MKLENLILAGFLGWSVSTAFGENFPKPDITVAADGSGDFKTIQAAVASIPETNRDRIVVFIKDGLYNEKIRVDASFVTLRGRVWWSGFNMG
jgi:pectinesterase